MSKTYRSKQSQKEEYTSTAYTFTGFGILGLILAVLIGFHVFSFLPEGFSNIFSGTVICLLSLVFLFIGLHAFSRIKTLDAEAKKESSDYKEITEWFLANYDKSDLDSGLAISPLTENAAGDDSPEQLYFPRYEKMTGIIRAEFPDLEDSFLDHIVETLYETYYG